MFEIARKDTSPRTIWDDFWTNEELFSPIFVPSKRLWTPSVELEESDTDFSVRLDVPGLKKDEISIETKGDLLTISGERKTEKTANEKGRKYTERYYGTFSRTIRLPDQAKTEDISASYTDGVLEVKVPKAPGSKTRKIAVH
jgi:HSP20 family protein